MRRLIVVVVGVLVLVAAASASASTERQRDAPWTLLGVSADGRSLLLGYDSGGCLLDDGRPVVSESKHKVVVTVRQTEGQPVEGGPCTADRRFPHVSVPLKTALNGRRVRGGPHSAYDVTPPTSVPRTVGMDRRDAIASLRAQGFRVKTVGPVRRGRVIRQRPRPGTEAPIGVRLPVIRLRVR